MLKIVKSSKKKIATVTGCDVHRLMFYCFWQLKLWPEWMDYRGLGHTNDSLTKQHKMVLKTLSNSSPLLLSFTSGEFEDALYSAIDKCSLLGIQFDVVSDD
jgi:hypothetical protein